MIDASAIVAGVHQRSAAAGTADQWQAPLALSDATAAFLATLVAWNKKNAENGPEMSVQIYRAWSLLFPGTLVEVADAAAFVEFVRDLEDKPGGMPLPADASVQPRVERMFREVVAAYEEVLAATNKRARFLGADAEAMFKQVIGMESVTRETSAGELLDLLVAFVTRILDAADTERVVLAAAHSKTNKRGDVGFDERRLDTPDRKRAYRVFCDQFVVRAVSGYAYALLLLSRSKSATLASLLSDLRANLQSAHLFEPYSVSKSIAAMAAVLPDGHDPLWALAAENKSAMTPELAAAMEGKSPLEFLVAPLLDALKYVRANDTIYPYKVITAVPLTNAQIAILAEVVDAGATSAPDILTGCAAKGLCRGPHTLVAGAKLACGLDIPQRRALVKFCNSNPAYKELAVMAGQAARRLPSRYPGTDALADAQASVVDFVRDPRLVRDLGAILARRASQHTRKRAKALQEGTAPAESDTGDADDEEDDDESDADEPRRKRPAAAPPGDDGAAGSETAPPGGRFMLSDSE